MSYTGNSIAVNDNGVYRSANLCRRVRCDSDSSFALMCTYCSNNWTVGRANQS